MVSIEEHHWPAGVSLDDAQVDALHSACHGDPSAILGCHRIAGADASTSSETNSLYIVRVWHPRLEQDWGPDEVLMRLEDFGDAKHVMKRRCAWLYEAVVELPSPPGSKERGTGPAAPLQRGVASYSVVLPDSGEPLQDAFSFAGSLLSEEELDMFQGGCYPCIEDAMGSHCVVIDGIWGLRFVVWAPRAQFASVVGDWNSWDGRASPMRRRCRQDGGGFTGLWELFVPFGLTREAVPVGSRYGYRMHTVHGTEVVKMDPFAQEFEVPNDLERCPSTNTSLLSSCDDSFREKPYSWSDAAWLQQREELRRTGQLLREPMAIYEVHLPSWRRGGEGEVLGYRSLAPLLLEHVQVMNFNFVELVGLAHHPFSGSWGYQVSGFYACYSLLGSPDDFKYFVDTMHEAGIGVLMDFVPAHFCKDPCSFSNYDGTATFEYEDPREGEQPEWGTKIFCYRKNEVRSFLIGSALFWARRYHIDGFRCDAITCMIYRNFGRADGQWIPNEHGGDSNIEAVTLLRDINFSMRALYPGVLMIAEESTAWEGVTDLRGGSSCIGFDLKWDLGWMNDTLFYLMECDANKPPHHWKLTQRQRWMNKERYVLPLSHDEVTNMKGSLLAKMGRHGGGPDFYDRLRLLCALYGFQVASPGRFLLFQGQEFGQGAEWHHNQSLHWHEASEPLRGQLCTWLSDLLGVYRHYKPLHAGDDEPYQIQSWCAEASFECLESNADACVLAFLRHWYQERPVLVICNLGPRAHPNYVFRAPYWGEWQVLLNSDDHRYGGRGVGPGNLACLRTRQGGRSDCSESLTLDVPAESCVLLLGPEEFSKCKTTWHSSAGASKVEFFNDACELGFDDTALGF